MIFINFGRLELCVVLYTHEHFDIACCTVQRRPAGIRMAWAGRPVFRLGSK